MLRSLSLVIASAWALGWALPVSANASERTLPMRFDLRMQGSADSCGAKCETWISASGAITADTARDFIRFANGRDLANATVVLDSDGGSVLGALALGREIRRLSLNTTVGRTVDLPRSSNNEPRTALLPRADCESMCAFVLLAGIRRTVPIEARVMVHQIWLGDRREDPTAANYSAEDLVLVQRDIGRLARYTAEMGASIDLLDFALRIPPWEPMKALTRAELRNTKLTTDNLDTPAAATLAASPPAAVAAPPAPRVVTDGTRAAPINQQRWAMVDRSGTATLARHHPLTVEGETIGSFDLSVTCGSDATTYDVSYVERRRKGEQIAVPANLAAVTMRVGNARAKLKVATSERAGGADELVTYAAGSVSASLIGGFAATGGRSMVIETETDGMVTVIRLGNTGAQVNLPQLAASCAKGGGDRAELPQRKAAGFAAAQ
jgi:hypothetical protein